MQRFVRFALLPALLLCGSTLSGRAQAAISPAERPVKSAKACNEELNKNRAAIEAAGETDGEFFHACWWHSTPGQPTPIAHAGASDGSPRPEGEKSPDRVADGDDAAPATRHRHHRHARAAYEASTRSSRSEHQRRFIAYTRTEEEDVPRRQRSYAGPERIEPVRQPPLPSVADSLNDIAGRAVSGLAPIQSTLIQTFDPLGIIPR